MALTAGCARRGAGVCSEEAWRAGLARVGAAEVAEAPGPAGRAGQPDVEPTPGVFLGSEVKGNENGTYQEK